MRTFADGVPVLKCQSTGPENHCICSSTYCSDVNNGSACRTWTPNLRWVWGHGQVGLIGRRTESCPEISQPENSHDSSLQAALFPGGHLAMSGDLSCLEFTEKYGSTASREWGPEVLLITHRTDPVAECYPAPKCQRHQRRETSLELRVQTDGEFSSTAPVTCVSQIARGSEQIRAASIVAAQGERMSVV